ncbi:ABC transporter permease [Serpentinicella alkaliphila]|uniref:Putative ABC transport system permease protein n=1 Tax=Serpentinicella alkaliphila TaxID=1734049 RepID=A0A4R2TS40_9FIRM|nr:FtsX-like permease family protein [Serpentinicella alkaliphila]QUH25620.1 ABC transporter permease [Serpentinicella alkaliphila]TCQ06670.1 putative ABC transport system permease protein [Serpentinicella alkaliphila]
MNIFQIAFSNLKRRKIKMLFLMMGLVVGVATVVAFQSIILGMNLDLGNRIDELGANVVIIPRSEGFEAHYGGTMVSDVTFDAQELTLDDIPNIYASSVAEYINIVSPKLVGAVKIEGKNTLIVGVETKKEFMQKPWFSLKEQVDLKPGESTADLGLIELPEDNVIVGTTAAKALNLEIGDLVKLNDQSFRVFGVLNELGSEEDGLIYANLSVVQNLLDKPNELSMIEVSAYCNYCPIEEIAMGLEEAIPNGRVISMRQAALFREETIEKFSKFGYALSGMVLLIAALVVLTTMVSSVNERTREIGIFRAVGFRKIHIIKILFLEIGMISALGGTIGYLIGIVVARYAGPYLAQISGEIPFQFGWFLPVVLTSIGLSILISLYPALKAARLDPAEALRFI